MSVHAFTSITANYIPKARVLGRSLKALRPDIHFHLVLNDRFDGPLDLSREPFDTLLYVDDLPIENRPAWLFQHSVVELCTASKGLAFLEIARRFDADKVLYFDPDIVVFGRVDELVEHLDSASILLTPHLCTPEESAAAIIDNEIGALKHGVFNLGFLGVRTDDQGLAFLRWWSDRLIQFCVDDVAGGLFTDQRWADLIPCFFPSHHVLRSSAFNVATWNITHRHVEGSLKEGIAIDGEPLGFYHFSGFDSGAQKLMLDKYANGRAALYELRSWYERECEACGQQEWGGRSCYYATYQDGTGITRSQRRMYRNSPELQRRFPDPYRTDDQAASLLHWFQSNRPEEAAAASGLQGELNAAKSELELIKHSRTWKLRSRLVGLLRWRRA